MSHKTKKTEIDLMRGIAILSVIIIHVSGYFTNIKQINGLMITMATIDFFAHFAVPLFVFISGFVLMLSSKEKIILKTFYKRRILKIIPPYLIFSTLYLLLSSLTLSPFSLNIPDFSIILLKLLTATSFSHLWFIALIVQFYLVFPLLRKFSQSSFLTLSNILLAIGIQIIWQICAKFVLHNFEFNDFIQSFFQTFVLGSFISYIGYFLLGMYFSKNNLRIIQQLEKIKYLWLMFLIISLTSLISYYHLSLLSVQNNFYNLPWKSLLIIRFLSPFLYIATFLFLYKLCLKNIPIFVKNTLTLFSKYSFGIYLTHHGILYVLGYLLINFTSYNENTCIFYLITLTLTIAFSFIVTYLISFLPKHKYIIG